MLNRAGQRRRDLAHRDVQGVVVVELKDLRYQSGADPVGLARLRVDDYPHEQE
jgi:hypothetical protein